MKQALESSERTCGTCLPMSSVEPFCHVIRGEPRLHARTSNQSLILLGPAISTVISDMAYLEGTSEISRGHMDLLDGTPLSGPYEGAQGWLSCEGKYCRDHRGRDHVFQLRLCPS